MASSAILFATAPARSGGAAATLAYRGSLLRELVDQLAGLGLDRVVVLTRECWSQDCERAVSGAPLPVQVVASPDLPGDLAQVSRLAAAATCRLVLAGADLAVSRHGLAGLLLDPRVGNGALITDQLPPPAWAAPVRLARGRVLSAGSAFHAARRPNAACAGVLTVTARQAGVLAGVAAELAELATPPLPPSWQEHAAQARGCTVDVGPPAVDPAPLLLVGLVRSGIPMTAVGVRGFLLDRPSSDAAARSAERAAASIDEDRVLLDAAVKASDGAFTTFLVSPYSKHLARGAARRGWTPNQVTTGSLLLGLLAAGAFAAGTRPGLVLGAVLLQAAFTADCVDGQLARYTRTFSSGGAWLDSVFDRTKEYAVYAGLAIGSVRGFGDDVWPLAIAALVLQTARHAVDFSYAGAQHLVIGATEHPPLSSAQDVLPAVDGEGDALPDPAASTGRSRSPRLVAIAGRGAIRASRALERSSATRYGKKILVLPIGERFALISLTAAFGSPRQTFRALLGWGAVAATYGLTGKLLRSGAA